LARLREETWKALPWWRRLLTKRPFQPTGI
jgi:hypothetical protein